MKLDLLAKYLLTAVLALCQLNTQAASQAPVAAENGMVVTAQHLATHVGVDVLRAGGSEAPLLNPLMELLAIRLGYQKSIAKSLVIPQAGEEANEKSNR